MSQDLIDLHRPSWGKLYQGTPVVPGDLVALPKPLALVAMNERLPDYIDHAQGTHVQIDVKIDDSPEAVLPDGVILGLARTVAGLLRSGVNVRVQCGAGVSRSSYLTVAAVMSALELGFEPALAIVRSSRPIVQPNSGFTAHLQRLESQLSAAT